MGLYRFSLALVAPLGVAAAVLLLCAGPVRAAAEVDLQLILAVDCSASIDAREFDLQMAGIAAAFRDGEVVEAIRSGRFGRIAVAAIFWAEAGYPIDATPWYLVGDGASSAAFARTIERWPRRVEGGTGIGSAIFKGVKMIEASGYVSPRQIIDVSGDGRETTMREFRITPSLARNMAAGRGITVNGLAILDDEPDLDAYYRDEVIGGPGAFVEVANTIDDFARAMRVKLLREIEHRPVVGQLTAPPAS